MLGSHSATAVVEVSPSRIEVSVVRGRRVVASAWRRIDDPEFESGWPRSLSGHSTTLADLVREVGCEGSRAVALLTAPRVAGTLASCPSSSSETEAEGAALLAVGAVADFPVDREPCAVRRVHADASSGAGASRNAHFLSAAMRSDDVEAVARFIKSAGLRFAGAAPVGAVAMLAALKGAASLGRRAGDRSAVLWIGEHGSALAAVVDGAVKFVRPVALGVESLVEALQQQPLRSRDESIEVRLDRPAARALLGAAGVPAPDAPLHGHEGVQGLTGAAVLPIIQPALQRIAIETRQSLRFGLAESERSSVRLRIDGPGACVPGLGEWIANQCGLGLVDAPVERGRLDSSAHSGAIAAFAAHADLVPLLVPARMAARRAHGRARVALAAGVALAGALQAWEWRSATAALEAESARLASLQARADADRAVAQTRAATLGARLALAEAESRAGRTTGQAPHAAATLAAVASAARNVRVTSIDITREADGSVARIDGFVRLSESEDPAADIRAFVEALSASPVAASARLSATQRVQIDGAQSQSFSVTMNVVDLPVLRVGLAAAAEESRP